MPDALHPSRDVGGAAKVDSELGSGDLADRGLGRTGESNGVWRQGSCQTSRSPDDPVGRERPRPARTGLGPLPFSRLRDIGAGTDWYSGFRIPKIPWNEELVRDQGQHSGLLRCLGCESFHVLRPIRADALSQTSGLSRCSGRSRRRTRLRFFIAWDRIRLLPA